MCRIAYCGTRKLTTAEIQEAHKYNSDGIGIGWAKDGFTRFEKGFKTTKKFIEFYNTFEELPHVIHFRKTSIGEPTPQLCHPFLVTDEPEEFISLSGWRKAPLLFHNGTWNDWINAFYPYALMSKGKFNPKEWSDSRFIALLAHKFGPAVFDEIGGRYALIQPNGEIEIYGEWVERDDIVYSNLRTYNTQLSTSIMVRN